MSTGALARGASETSAGLHVAIIMDGNGRWARARGLPRVAGHRAGVESLRGVVEACPGLGVSTLTAYAFSADNWKRPAAEVDALMALFRSYLAHERRELARRGVSVNVIGRRDRLQPSLVRAIDDMEAATAGGSGLHLRLAVDYSSRDALLRAFRSARGPGLASRGEFSWHLNRAVHSKPAAPDVDLLIRTSGEKRISDFLLWEIAYAELLFVERHWPDFGPADLSAAVHEFRGRDRRFGGVDAEDPAAG